MDTPHDVAQQIEILLTGLARRAKGVGLESLELRLLEVAKEAGEQAREAARKQMPKK